MPKGTTAQGTVHEKPRVAGSWNRNVFLCSSVLLRMVGVALLARGVRGGLTLACMSTGKVKEAQAYELAVNLPSPCCCSC